MTIPRRFEPLSCSLKRQRASMIKIDSLNEKVYCEVLGDVNIACLKTSRRVLWGLIPRDVAYGDKTRAASFLQCLINERECFIGV